MLTVKFKTLKEDYSNHVRVNLTEQFSPKIRAHLGLKPILSQYSIAKSRSSNRPITLPSPHQLHKIAVTIALATIFSSKHIITNKVVEAALTIHITLILKKFRAHTPLAPLAVLLKA